MLRGLLSCQRVCASGTGLRRLFQYPDMRQNKNCSRSSWVPIRHLERARWREAGRESGAVRVGGAVAVGRSGLRLETNMKLKLFDDRCSVSCPASARLAAAQKSLAAGVLYEREGFNSVLSIQENCGSSYTNKVQQFSLQFLPADQHGAAFSANRGSVKPLMPIEESLLAETSTLETRPVGGCSVRLEY